MPPGGEGGHPCAAAGVKKKKREKGENRCTPPSDWRTPSAVPAGFPFFPLAVSVCTPAPVLEESTRHMEKAECLTICRGISRRSNGAFLR